MVVLKELENKEEITAFFEKENLELNQNSSCLCAKEKDQVLGYCLFDIDKNEMIVRAIGPQSDLMLLDGILRSTLHIAASRNLKKAVYSENAPEKTFKTLGFVTEKNTLNINKLFESKCCCQK